MHLHRITTLALTCLPLVLPAPAAAQKRLISQAALITIVENHKGAALRYIDAAPDSMLGFRPTPGVRTFAQQIEHAAGSDALIAHMAITGSATGIPPMGDTAVYLHLSRKHLTSVTNPLDTISVSNTNDIKRSRKLQKR